MLPSTMLVAYQNVPLDFMRALGADLLPAPGRRNEHLFHGLNRYRVEARLERVAPVLGRALDVLRDARDLSRHIQPIRMRLNSLNPLKVPE
jgi:hypothetical protein